MVKKVRTVRNFWVDLDIDGYEKTIGAGPKSADEGFHQEIFMRDKGKVILACSIVGMVDEQGRLRLEITPETGGAFVEALPRITVLTER